MIFPLLVTLVIIAFILFIILLLNGSDGDNIVEVSLVVIMISILFYLIGKV